MSFFLFVLYVIYFCFFICVFYVQVSFFFSLGCKCPRAGVYPSYTNTANTQQALTSTRASCHPTARENVFCVTRKGGVPWQRGMRNSASS